MSRSITYTFVLMLGCTIGITFGYISTRDSFKALTDSTKNERVSIPTMLVQDGIVEKIDTQSRTILITTTAPYDYTTPISMRVTYDSMTAFWNQFSEPISAASITTKSKVRMSINRAPGTFYTKRVVIL